MGIHNRRHQPRAARPQSPNSPDFLYTPNMGPEPSRLRKLWTRRKGTILWSAVAVLAVVVVAVIGSRVLSGATTPPKSFSFSFGASACNCTRETQITHAFPAQSTVKFQWWVKWTGANATAQLAVSSSGGKVVYLAIAEYQFGNASNLSVPWLQGGGGTFSGQGSPFTFLIDLVSTPDFLPPNTAIWVNGTYASPLL
jgi:hypothetical protein